MLTTFIIVSLSFSLVSLFKFTHDHPSLHTHTHTRVRAHTHTHTHTHTRTHAHTHYLIDRSEWLSFLTHSFSLSLSSLVGLTVVLASIIFPPQSPCAGITSSWFFLVLFRNFETFQCYPRPFALPVTTTKRFVVIHDPPGSKLNCFLDLSLPLIACPFFLPCSCRIFECITQSARNWAGRRRNSSRGQCCRIATIVRGSVMICSSEFEHVCPGVTVLVVLSWWIPTSFLVKMKPGARDRHCCVSAPSVQCEETDIAVCRHLLSNAKRQTLLCVGTFCPMRRDIHCYVSAPSVQCEQTNQRTNALDWRRLKSSLDFLAFCWFLDHATSHWSHWRAMCLLTCVVMRLAKAYTCSQ